MIQLNQLCGPALVFFVLAVLVFCVCVMAGRAADNAGETEEHLWR